uniref:Uncharacterized protein n=1 Tax=Knipowitschia caucasica TaxID=637954 RepID=A0AAV2MTA7_KNICA
MVQTRPCTFGPWRQRYRSRRSSLATTCYFLLRRHGLPGSPRVARFATGCQVRHGLPGSPRVARFATGCQVRHGMPD